MMKIILPKETLSVIKDIHIFVDTCILFDFATLKDKEDKVLFIENISSFIDNGCFFVTLEPIAVEFFLGSTRQDIKDKKKYFGQLIKTTLPVRILEKEVINDLIVEYGRYARSNVSYADLCLGASAKQFPKSVVLTRNYKDFPLNIFDCQGIFTMHLNVETRSYCFYSYKKKKAKKKAKKNVAPF